MWARDEVEEEINSVRDKCLVAWHYVREYVISVIGAVSYAHNKEINNDQSTLSTCCSRSLTQKELKIKRLNTRVNKALTQDTHKRQVGIFFFSSKTMMILWACVVQ